MTVSETSAADLEAIHGFAKDRIDVVTEAADDAFRMIDDPGFANVCALIMRSRWTPSSSCTSAGECAQEHSRPPQGHAADHRGGTRDVFALVGDTSGKGFWDNVDELKAFVAARLRFPTSPFHRLPKRSGPGRAPECFGRARLPVALGRVRIAGRRGHVVRYPRARQQRPRQPARSGGPCRASLRARGSRRDANCVIGFLRDEELRARLARTAIERPSCLPGPEERNLPKSCSSAAMRMRVVGPELSDKLSDCQMRLSIAARQCPQWVESGH